MIPRGCRTMTVNALSQMDKSSRTTLASNTSSQDFEDFIYLVSHDVRNSVRALIELPQWIVEDLSQAGVRIDGSVAESIELMNRHTGRLDRMLVDLLSFSRVGRLQEIREVELDTVLTEILEETRLPPGFTLIPELDSNLITIGERDIRTLFTALVSNAVKHHDRTNGKISISVSERKESVHVLVSDDGPGIPEKFHEKVFGAMTTLRPRDEVEGSGMGLAIVQKIARIYGGHVSLGPATDGRGTSVEVVLPRSPDGSGGNTRVAV